MDTWISIICGCQSSIIHTSVDIQIDIQAGVSMQGHSALHIHEWTGHLFLWISVFNYPCFYGYPFGYPWISTDIHGSTCYGFSIQGVYLDKTNQKTYRYFFRFIFTLK